MRGHSRFYQIGKKVGTKETAEIPQKKAVRLRDNWYVLDETIPIGLFRMHRFADDFLMSLDQTLKYLETYDYLIQYSDDDSDRDIREKRKEKVIEIIKDFWKRNPSGMIRFR